MHSTKRHRWMTLLIVTASWLAGPMAQADVVSDWNIKAGDIAVAAKLPPPTYRVMTIVQSAVYEAVNAIIRRYLPERLQLDTAPDAPVDATVAAANRATLSKLVPSQQAAIESAYQAAVSAIPDGLAKTAGIAAGEQAAVARPEPPPSLTSDLWARDYNEIKAIGAKNSTSRTTEQTDIARFWSATVPTIYFPVVRSVADAPGRDLTQNARFLAVAGQAMDDALIAVLDAKYHYEFWRPITAIRNGDMDGNDATERDASWVPFIDTPMHPEYPCAHCIISAAVGAVLEAEIGAGPTPMLSTTSATAPGMVRSWTTIDDFVQEVANARIYDGMHYRTSTEVGIAMGKKIGELAALKYLRPLP